MQFGEEHQRPTLKRSKENLVRRRLPKRDRSMPLNRESHAPIGVAEVDIVNTEIGAIFPTTGPKVVVREPEILEKGK